MKKVRTMTIFLSLILLTSCSSYRFQNNPRLSSINLTDRTGICQTFTSQERLKEYEKQDLCDPQPYQKILRVYERNNQGNIKSCITTYYDNGQIKQYLEVSNGRACGAYREWHSNGTLKIDSHVLGGIGDLTPYAEESWFFDGTCRAWDENGCLLANFCYGKGFLEGESTYYFPSGEISKTVSFKNGEIDGPLKSFFVNGELQESIEFKQGVKQGKSVSFWEEGPLVVASEEIYEEDLLVEGNYYNQDKEEIASIVDGKGWRAIFEENYLKELHEYSNGLQEGMIKVFNKKGHLLRSYLTKDHLKHGEEVEYYEQKPGIFKNQQKILITWYEGKIQGTVKTWYENGIQESQREMNNNKKNGFYSAWYKNGEIMMIEEYQMEKLARGDYFKRGEGEPISKVENGEGKATFYDAEGNFLYNVSYFNGQPEV